MTDARSFCLTRTCCVFAADSFPAHLILRCSQNCLTPAELRFGRYQALRRLAASGDVDSVRLVIALFRRYDQPVW